MHAKTKQRTMFPKLTLSTLFLSPSVSCGCQCLHTRTSLIIPSFMYQTLLCCPPLKRAAGLGGVLALPSTFFNVYLTHARTPLPPYSHVRAEYYENTVTLTHILLQVVYHLMAAGWLVVTLAFLNTQTVPISLLCCLFSFVPVLQKIYVQ